MRVALLEDDPEMRGTTKEAIQRILPGAEVIEFRTEHRLVEFVESRRQFVGLFILDMMVPWTEAAEDMPLPPDEVLQGGFSMAGLRCAHRIRQKGDNTPIVLLTVLGQEEMPGYELTGVIFVQKSEDYRKLENGVRKALSVDS